MGGIAMQIRKSWGSGNFRSTLSKSGLSETAGRRWLRLTDGTSGLRYAVRVSGSGISMRRRSKKG